MIHLRAIAPLTALWLAQLWSAELATAGTLPTAIAEIGKPTPGSSGLPVVVLNSPFMTSDGRPAFTGAVSNGGGPNTHFVWFDGAIVWLNSDALPVLLTSAESTMGIGDSGQWIYSPSEAGLDAVWSNGASLQKETQPAPGIPGGFIVFASRPQMNADGTPTWVAGITGEEGGPTSFRALYVDNEVIIAGGSPIGGEQIAQGASLGFAYDFSRDGLHWIVRAIIVAPSTSDDIFLVNDRIAAREGDPTGEGDAWQGFGECKINNNGRHVFSGDTNGPAATDGFIALDNDIILREGDPVGGGFGTLTGNPAAVAINDLDQIGFIWNTSSGEVLGLLTPPLSGSPSFTLLLKVGDMVDLDGDGVADGSVTDFNASASVGPGLDLPRQCCICVNVDVAVPGLGEVGAIVCMALPVAPGVYDINADGAVDGSDLGLLLSGWNAPGVADFNCDGIVDGGDLGLLLGGWGAAPACGGSQTGDCYTPQGTPYCNDAACCEAVCLGDPFCCEVAWDLLCASTALLICDARPSCGNALAGDCCTPDGTPYCNDLACCDAVCDVIPACCLTAWDEDCAGEAFKLCDACQGCGSPFAGDCCGLHFTPYCNDESCCEAVCASFAFCCQILWDLTCAANAFDNCPECIQCGSALAGDCCTSNGTPYCDFWPCCNAVCDAIPSCCVTVWDQSCVSEATEICEGCLGCGNQFAGNCCAANDTPYCDDEVCCQAVCAVDPFCCDVQWDGVCADGAVELCLACPGCGNMFAHSCFAPGAPFCDDKACCEAVCAADNFCCTIEWDVICVSLAETICD